MVVFFKIINELRVYNNKLHVNSKFFLFFSHREVKLFLAKALSLLDGIIQFFYHLVVAFVRRQI